MDVQHLKLAALKSQQVAELKVCRNLRRGNEIHANAMRTATISCIYVATALINMYAKCGSMCAARQVFHGIQHPDVVSWTALILGYAENEEAVTALELFVRMGSQGCAPNSRTFVAALKACTALAVKQDRIGRTEYKELGKQLHSHIGCHSNTHVQSILIDLYGKCRSMSDARDVFEGIKHPHVGSWNSLILGYAENNDGVTALNIFARMSCEGCAPNSITFVAAIKACISLAGEQDASGKAECRKYGVQIHSEIGCRLDSYLQNILIHMYAKCGCMADAYQVFECINQPDVVSWTALILGYAESGEGMTALDLFSRMRSQGCAPNSITFIAALKACMSLALNQDESGIAECRKWGTQIHTEIGFHSTNSVKNTLIDMYSKSGSMNEAQQVFADIEQPDVVSWTSLILGYVENNEGVTALDLLASMKLQGCAPNSLTYVAALKACGLLGALESGRKIHAQIDAEIFNGTERNATILVVCLVDFYAKCGSLLEAQVVFDSHPKTRNLRTWNALLGGYCRSGDSKAVFKLFEEMQDAGCQPTDVTFLCLLTCCSHAGHVEKAYELFEEMSSKFGIRPAVEHWNCMLDIIGRSNKLDDAITCLRSISCMADAVTWMTLLGACHKWKHINIGRLAFKSLLKLNATNEAAYVLMAQIYRNEGMWDEVMEMRKKFVWKE